MLIAKIMLAGILIIAPLSSVPQMMSNIKQSIEPPEQIVCTLTDVIKCELGTMASITH